MKVTREYVATISFDDEADGCQEFLRLLLEAQRLDVRSEIVSGHGRDRLKLAADYLDTLDRAVELLSSWSSPLGAIDALGCVIDMHGRVWHPASDDPVGTIAHMTGVLETVAALTRGSRA